MPSNSSISFDTMKKLEVTNEYKLWELSVWLYMSRSRIVIISHIFILFFSLKFLYVRVSKAHYWLLMGKSGIIGSKFKNHGHKILKFRKMAVFPPPLPELLIHTVHNLLLTTSMMSLMQVFKETLNCMLQVVPSCCVSPWPYLWIYKI